MTVAGPVAVGQTLAFHVSGPVSYSRPDMIPGWFLMREGHILI